MEADLRKKTKQNKKLSREEKPLLRNGTDRRVPQKGKLCLPVSPPPTAATPPNAHGEPGAESVSERSAVTSSDSADDWSLLLEKGPLAVFSLF